MPGLGLDLAQDKAPERYGTKLIQRDFRVQVASLGQARTITRQLLNRVLGDLNPEYITLQRLYQMRRDTMLKMGMYYRKSPLLRLKWHIECEGRPDIAATIDQIIRRRWGSYTRIALQKFDFGYKGMITPFELGTVDASFEDEEGSVKPAWKSENVQPMVLDRPIPLPAEYARVHLNESDGTFAGIEVSLPFAQKNPKDNIVPPDWCLWWANEFEETDNNWYGFPLLGYGYRFWWSSWFRHHMEDRHFEQKADPPLVASYPEGTYVDPQGRVHQHRDIALQMGDDLRGGATIAMPSTIYRDPESGAMKTQPMWDAKFLTGGENMSAFTASAEYLDIMKLRSMLVPEQALIEGVQGTGSRATSTVHESIFEEAEEQEGDELVEGFNHFIIPRIQDANYPPDTPKAKMVVDGQDDIDKEFYQGLVETAFTLDPNALPINWETVLKNLKVPQYTKKEQEERLQAEQDLQAQQALENPNDPNAPLDQVPGAQTGPQPGAGGVVNMAGQYFQPREVLHLHSGPKVSSKRTPGWAHREGERRARNTAAVAERVQQVTEDFYRQAFDAVAEYAASVDLAQPQDQQSAAQTAAEAAIAAQAAGVAAPSTPGATGAGLGASAITTFLSGAAVAVGVAAERLRRRLTGELASLYHVSGAAELSRLGLSAETWDVGRDEVQDWAREKAGDLIVTLPQTIVERHLKPFLSQRLQRPFNAIELAQEISDKYAGYPKWMAERVARTEASIGYNLSAADMWERVGVEGVVMFDGLGGASGKTDAECLRRNGETVTIDEFREEVEKEHPNGTLGAVPDLESVTVHPPPASTLAANFAQSDSVYAITEDGLILSQEETGAVLAGV